MKYMEQKLEKQFKCTFMPKNFLHNSCNCLDS